MKNIKSVFIIVFLATLSLTPVFWFFRRPGILIDGVDTNFPLNPALWFLRRFFVWQNLNNGGSDFSASVAGTFFHLIQVIPYKIGLSLQGVEIFSLVFWFAAIVLGSWFLSRLLLPKKNIPQLIFVTLYSLNIYLFNSFENVKVANLSLVASIPWALSVLILLKEKRISRIHASFFTLLIGILLSGTGINPAYIMSFFGVLFIFYFGEILSNISNKYEVKSLTIDFTVTCFSLIMVNLYWILPTLNFIFGNISSSNSIGSIGFTNWVDGLSQNTSIVNVIRMLGAWDWYIFDSVTKLPIYIPYATKYFFSPIFVGFSFLVPSLAVLSFLIRKKSLNYLYLSFGVMLIVGIFLTTGTHTPTGGLFSFFSRHIPFFSLFRSPWYIFAPLVGLSIAGLTSLLFAQIERVDKILKVKLTSVVGVIFLAGTLIYAYPLLVGKIFRPNFPGGFYVKFPDYVFDTANWLNETNDSARILSYPDDELKDFSWGYRGVSPIFNLISNQAVISSSIVDTSSSFSQTISKLYESIKKGQTEEVKSLSYSLGIDRLFNKSDQISIAPALPQELKQNKMATFGEWNFYKILDTPAPKVRSISQLMTSDPAEDFASKLSLIDKNQILVNPNDTLLKDSSMKDLTGEIISAKNSQLKDLLTVIASSDVRSRFVSHDPKSVEFDFNLDRDSNYQSILDIDGLRIFGLNDQGTLKVNLDGHDYDWKISKVNDSFVYFNPISLSRGSHKVIMSIANNSNLIDLTNASKLGEGLFEYSDGIYTLTNQSNQDFSLKFPIKDFDSTANYLISFRYKEILGNNGLVQIDQFQKNNLIGRDLEHLPNSPEWQNFSFYYHPTVADSNLYLSLVIPRTQNDVGTKVSISNVQVFRVFTNNLYLINEPARSLSTSNVTFQEKSPVSYTGEVRNGDLSHIIVFNENYSNDWQINIVGSPNAKIFHFTADSYANAWYVKDTSSNYKFTIYYKPQTYLKFGYLISGAVVFVITVVFVYTILLKKKNG